MDNQSWFGEWMDSSGYWRTDRPRDPTEDGTDSRTQYTGAYYCVETIKTENPEGRQIYPVKFTDPEPEYSDSSDYTASFSIGVGYGPFAISVAEPISVEFGSGGTTLTMDGETNPSTPDEAYNSIEWDIESDTASWYSYATKQEDSPGCKFNIESLGLQYTDYDDPYSDKDFSIKAQAQDKFLYVDMFMEYNYDETPIQTWYNAVDVI